MRRFWIPCVLVACLCSPQAGLSSNENINVLFGGFSTAARYGLKPRTGVDFALLNGKRSDGFGGYGAVMGASNFEDGEFYLGPAMGIFYIGSYWAEAVVQFRKMKYNGIRATGAFGFFLMPFVSVGYNHEPLSPTLELGVMLRFPFLFFDR
jgi:hypothetical protein